MNINYNPLYKNLIENVKIEFINEGIKPPEFILSSCALPNSNPREIFLIKICNILMSKLVDLKTSFKSNTKQYIFLKNKYNQFENELKVCDDGRRV